MANILILKGKSETQIRIGSDIYVCAEYAFDVIDESTSVPVNSTYEINSSNANLIGITPYGRLTALVGKDAASMDFDFMVVATPRDGSGAIEYDGNLAALSAKEVGADVNDEGT